MSRKLKVLLLQLPFPLFNHNACEFFSSIPLAAGYLKAMAYKTGILNRCDIEIMDFVYNEFCGDAMLIDTVAAKRPDVIGLSLYVWNINRSLYIIKEIKSKLPNVITVIGGPGVTTEYSHIDNYGVDIAVYGEGENPFAQILKYLSCGEPRLENIGNICFKNNGGYITTPPGKVINDLNEIPSPYLLHFIKPSVYKRVWLETMRWCPYKCKYCLYYKRSARKNPFYATERIKKEILLAKSEGVKVIDLHDSAFNLSPKFIEICREIAKINQDKALKFKVFLRPELITEETVDWLLKCNIVGTEVGLQSTNPITLRNIGRHNNLEKFLRGVNLLKNAGIPVLVDIMAGLPGDTLQSISETIAFLKKHKLDSSSAFTILSVSPATTLWNERQRFGLKIQKQPPYYVLSTPTLAFGDMKRAIELCRKETNSKLTKTILSPDNNTWFPFLYTYSCGRYPRRAQALSEEKPIDYMPHKIPVTQIILDIDPRTQTLEQVKGLASIIEKRVANVTTVWFHFSSIDPAIKYIKIFLETISRANPYTIWHILLETNTYLSLEFIREVERSISYRVNHRDYLNVFSNESPETEYSRQATRIYVVLPFFKVTLQKTTNYYVTFPLYIFYSLLIKKGINLKALVADLTQLDCTGYLIDFAPEVTAEFIIDVFELLKYKRGSKVIRFKNRLHQVLWDTKYDDSSICTAGEVDLCLAYDRYLKEKVTIFQKEKVKFDSIEWGLSSGKFQ